MLRAVLGERIWRDCERDEELSWYLSESRWCDFELRERCLSFLLEGNCLSEKE